MQAESPDAVQATGAAHVTIQRLDISDRTVGSIAIAAAFLSIGLAVLAMGRSQIAEREARLAQQDAMLLRATLVAYGIKVDEDKLHTKER